MDRRGKKLLGPGAVASDSNVEGGLSAAVALPDISNARPSDGDGTGVRGERERHGHERREREKLLQT